jgi:MYXO-CTERM domain-containing protein
VGVPQVPALPGAGALLLGAALLAAGRRRRDPRCQGTRT